MKTEGGEKMQDANKTEAEEAKEWVCSYTGKTEAEEAKELGEA